MRWGWRLSPGMGLREGRIRKMGYARVRIGPPATHAFWREHEAYRQAWSGLVRLCRDLARSGDWYETIVTPDAVMVSTAV